jgi:hypothetical protein
MPGQAVTCSRRSLARLPHRAARWLGRRRCRAAAKAAKAGARRLLAEAAEAGALLRSRRKAGRLAESRWLAKACLPSGGAEASTARGSAAKGRRLRRRRTKGAGLAKPGLVGGGAKAWNTGSGERRTLMYRLQSSLSMNPQCGPLLIMGMHWKYQGNAAQQLSLTAGLAEGGRGGGAKAGRGRSAKAGRGGSAEGGLAGRRSKACETRGGGSRGSEHVAFSMTCVPLAV